MAILTTPHPQADLWCGRSLRRIILDQSKRAQRGDIGSSLAVADLIAVLYGAVLKIAAPDDPDRDRLILSKGHAALALYGAFQLRGWLAAGQLDTFGGSNTLLGVCPEHALQGVDFSTGSLGIGLGYAAGAALAARMQGSRRRAFALLSDAECNEGAVWEAALFAAHHRLANLTAVIDLNGQQALGSTAAVLNRDRMSERWQVFGWDVHAVDGHDEAVLRDLFNHLNYQTGPPHVVIARTTFGKGVSFMEGKLRRDWPMDDAEYEQAVREVEGGPQ